ncbi:MAG: SIR2 family protein [Pseudonocardiaceae bacterium]
MAGGPVRIVTTNYDQHLSAVLRGKGIQFEEYVSPALPMGSDFMGVVYLHGNLRQEPRHLVLTDGDFGRAYLRDAWAARFLERMFATYTVLFVGYSHGDVVMRYLARALGPGATRYVLTSSPDASDWRALGLFPIGYPVVGDSHAALVDAVEGWASLASMGLLDHRQRIMQLVSAPPSQVPEEASYLEAVLANPDRVRLFTELARGEEWLSWAATQPEFRHLVDPSARPTGCTITLAYWFAEQFVMDEALTSFALGVIRDAGGRLGPTLWSAIGHHMHARRSPRPGWLGPWLIMLIQNAPEEGSDWLEYALVASRWSEDRPAALLLFDYLTEPQVQTAPAFGLPGRPRFDVRLRGSRYWLDEAWQKLFATNLAEAAPDVLAIADRHLRRAFHLLAATGSAGPGWDPVSFGRSAVEPHPQDRDRDAADVLIDATRDCLETLLNAGNALGVSYATAWSDSEVPILRRLALHGWIQRTDLDSTAKIAWLRERGWLFDHQLRHKVFRLIEVALPSAAAEVADALVADALAGPDGAADEEHRAYQQFNTLAWIIRHAPNLQSALDAFEQVQSQHPDFAEREHPDLLARVECGFVRPRAPMTAEVFHESIDSNTADAITELCRYENVSFPSEGPTWDGALSVLVESVRNHPLDGFAVLDAAGGDHPDIVNSVISGWSTATVDAETAEAILQRLTRVDLGAASENLSRLLSEGGQNETNPTKWFLFSAGRRLAADLWSAVDTAPGKHSARSDGRRDSRSAGGASGGVCCAGGSGRRG